MTWKYVTYTDGNFAFLYYPSKYKQTGIKCKKISLQKPIEFGMPLK